MPRVRHQNTRRVALAVLLGSLPACRVFVPTASIRFYRESSLPPASAAWLVATVCRHDFPATDTLPMHGAPEVLCTARDRDRFSVWFSRRLGDGFRSTKNGRITPPGTDRASIEGCRFVPETAADGSGAFCEDELKVEISPRVHTTGEPGTGCTIRVDLYGVPALGDLPERLSRALEAAEAIRSIELALDRGSIDNAESEAIATLAGRGPHCPGLRTLEARLHYLRARIDLAREDLITARSRLRLALERDSSLGIAKNLLARTCDRLADGASVNTKDIATVRRGAAAYLRAGDLPAAHAWARQSAALLPDNRNCLRLLAETLDRKGETRRALEEELLALDRFGFQASTVLRIASRFAKLDNPVAGLRMLVRFDAELSRVAPRRAGMLRQELTLAMEPGLAFRVLRIGGPALAMTLDRLDQVGPVCSHLYGRPSNPGEPESILSQAWLQDLRSTSPSILPAQPGR